MGDLVSQPGCSVTANCIPHPRGKQMIQAKPIGAFQDSGHGDQFRDGPVTYVRLIRTDAAQSQDSGLRYEGRALTVPSP